MNIKELYGKYFSKEHTYMLFFQVWSTKFFSRLVITKTMGLKFNVVFVYLCFHTSYSVQMDHVWEVTLKSDIPYNEKIMSLVKEFNLNHPYIYKHCDD